METLFNLYNKSKHYQPLVIDLSHSILALGFNHTCFLFDGLLKCWGQESSGQIDTPTFPYSNAQVDLLAAGASHTCAAKSQQDQSIEHQAVEGDGHGDRDENEEQRLILDDIDPDIDPDSGAERGAGVFNNHSIASEIQRIEPEASLNNLHKVIRCWGANSRGQTDVPLSLQAGVSHLTAGAEFSCGGTTGHVRCWGLNIQVPRSIQSDGANSLPTLFNAGVDVLQAGSRHACATLDRRGQPLCWGSNLHGATDVPEDLRIGSGSGGVWQMALGHHHTCALVGSGRSLAALGSNLKCWGSNSHKQTEIPQLGRRGVGMVAAKVDTTCVSNGSMRCQGRDDWGQTKVDAEVGRGVQVMGVGDDHVCAGKGDKVKCWGSNLWQQCDFPGMDL